MELKASRESKPDSQSPQAHRGSAQELFTKGDVELGMSNPTKGGDPSNSAASRLHESRQDYAPMYEAEGYEPRGK